MKNFKKKLNMIKINEIEIVNKINYLYFDFNFNFSFILLFFFVSSLYIYIYVKYLVKKPQIIQNL